MRVRFWGTRGSLPSPLNAASVRAKITDAMLKGAGLGLDTREKVDDFLDSRLSFAEQGTYGGNSACVEIEGGDEFLLLDLGSGAREFAQAALQRAGASGRAYNILMSHLHWDHIMGFPFFTPAFIPGTKIRIYGCHAELEESFRRQNAAPNFPVEFDALAADIEFVTLETDHAYDIAGFAITAHKQLHPGDSYGYRIEKNGKSAVYSTDSEHDLDDVPQIEGFLEFLRAADLVIFDAMYSHQALVSERKDWGHSSNVLAVDFCARAAVRHLCLFHHDPDSDDLHLSQILAETQDLGASRAAPPLRVSSAYDGMVVEL